MFECSIQLKKYNVSNPPSITTRGYSIQVDNILTIKRAFKFITNVPNLSSPSCKASFRVETLLKQLFS